MSPPSWLKHREALLVVGFARVAGVEPVRAPKGDQSGGEHGLDPSQPCFLPEKTRDKSFTYKIDGTYEVDLYAHDWRQSGLGVDDRFSLQLPLT